MLCTINAFLCQVDYSATCDEKIPLWKSWAASGKVQEAIDQLLALEKQTRTVSCISELQKYEVLQWTYYK